MLMISDQLCGEIILELSKIQQLVCRPDHAIDIRLTNNQASLFRTQFVLYPHSEQFFSLAGTKLTLLTQLFHLPSIPSDHEFAWAFILFNQCSDYFQNIQIDTVASTINWGQKLGEDSMKQPDSLAYLQAFVSNDKQMMLNLAERNYERLPTSPMLTMVLFFSYLYMNDNRVGQQADRIDRVLKQRIIHCADPRLRQLYQMSYARMLLVEGTLMISGQAVPQGMKCYREALQAGAVFIEPSTTAFLSLPVTHPLRVAFLQALETQRREDEAAQRIPCSKCGGRGRIKAHLIFSTACDQCNGKGYTISVS